jgi:hypothetical protein
VVAARYAKETSSSLCDETSLRYSVNQQQRQQPQVHNSSQKHTTGCNWCLPLAYRCGMCPPLTAARP